MDGESPNERLSRFLDSECAESLFMVIVGKRLLPTRRGCVANGQASSLSGLLRRAASVLLAEAQVWSWSIGHFNCCGPMPEDYRIDELSGIKRSVAARCELLQLQHS